MNLFVTSPDPVASAVVLADQHLVKMSLECCQILAAAGYDVRKADGTPYRVTHAHHPCVVWAKSDPRNAAWVRRHGFAMTAEYHKRRGVELAVGRVLRTTDGLSRLDAPVRFVAVVPDEIAGMLLPVCAAYRELLRRKYAAWAQTKRPGPARWTNAVRPAWLGDV